MGAPAKEETYGIGDEGAGGAKRRGSQRDSFKINLFPDNAFDAAQAKGVDDDDDEVCAWACPCGRLSDTLELWPSFTVGDLSRRRGIA